MDLAVGVIIGAAFGKIVDSLVKDIIMPGLGMIIGGIDFSNMKWVLTPVVLKDGKEITAEVAIRYGAFLQMTFNFIVIAFVIFCLVKGVNSLRRKHEEPPAPAPEDPADVKLLKEIRDLLAQRPVGNPER